MTERLRVRDVVARSSSPVALMSLLLACWGCLAIFNASFHSESPYWYVGRQLVWLTGAAVVMLVACAVGGNFHRRWCLYSAGAAYALLWLVLAFGVRIHDMRGWFSLRWFLLQPSELAKPFFVLFLAWLFHRYPPEHRDWRRGTLPGFAALLVWCLPLALQPDFGTALVYGATFACIFVVLGGRPVHLAMAGAAAAPLLGLALALNPYLRARFLGFLAPEQYAESWGWHILQFRRSLASGGLLGRSWGEGVWSRNFLPLSSSDSMFATMAEALGFFGVLPVIAVFLLLVVYGYKQLPAARDRFDAAAIAGLACLIAVQGFIHISVNLGLMPVTGLTLPLFSYGGSSLVATLLAVGILEATTTACRVRSHGGNAQQDAGERGEGNTNDTCDTD